MASAGEERKQSWSSGIDIFHQEKGRVIQLTPDSGEQERDGAPLASTGGGRAKGSKDTSVHENVFQLIVHADDDDFKTPVAPPKQESTRRTARGRNKLLNLLRPIMKSEIAPDSEKEIWFKFNGYTLRFDIREFALVTRLKCYEDDNTV
ncbi:hypothetical protein RND71_039767 [Anisodus tanguticus]|uniref:DUF1985 domain-containing protein n=1 Tax=Anisodus tanguticus TaxID=243964 RepID=A0AAE1QXS9_9SOLA|nr:hypothetical protein RND71_039767 [Anisodus tanguticus]